jgi:ribosome-associated protein
MNELEISREPIELYKILKIEGLVSSGGAAKIEIDQGRVLVNGVVETRRRKKIMSGDVVEYGGEKIRIRLETPS